MLSSASRARQEMPFGVRACLVFVVCAMLSLGLIATNAAASRIDTDLIPQSSNANTIEEIFTDGKATVNVRTRYEAVESEGYHDRANALTLRARLGFTSAEYRALSFVAELDANQSPGSQHFNSTVNEHNDYPVVADPNSFRLNRLSLRYRGKRTQIRVGRQRIAFDDQRFISTKGWRQNEQTFDSLRVVNRSIRDLYINYVYAWQVNQIFGRNAPVGTLGISSHFINLHYDGFDYHDISSFAYLNDFENSPERSTSSYGARADGALRLSDNNALLYAVSYVIQRPFAKNLNDFEHSYYNLEGGLRYRELTTRLGLETLEGNGATSFQTPSAGLHKFQGYADVFVTTPPEGLRDKYLSTNLKIRSATFRKGLTISAAYHEFETAESPIALGKEYDAAIILPFDKWFTITLKVADFNSSHLPLQDSRKFWLAVDYKY